jgi:hypothetical protein
MRAMPVEKGTFMAIPAMLAFDMDQTSGAEVGRIFSKVISILGADSL